MKRVMSVLFAAVLLCLPSVSLAQGNAFGGGGGGIPTDPTESIYTDGTDLILTTPGAGVVVEPAANTGSTLVFSEGTNQGTSTLSLGVGAGGLATNISCEFNAMGALPITCPIYKWYQPSRMAVKAITLTVLNTAYDNNGCGGAGACYIPFKELVTNTPLTAYTSPGSTCTVASNTDCAKAMSLTGGAGGTIWDVELTATVNVVGNNDCELELYKNNSFPPYGTLDLVVAGAAVGTVFTTTSAHTVASGATDTFGAYVTSTSTSSPNCGTGGQGSGLPYVGPTWGVDLVYTAVAR